MANDPLLKPDVAWPGTLSYVPGWDVIERDPEAEVTSGGIKLGFKVKEVHPTRQWALQADGEVLPRLEYLEKFRKWKSKTVPDGTQIVVPMTSIQNHFDVTLETVPLVEDFVNARFEEGSDCKTVPIKFDPHKPAEVKTKGRRYNYEGEFIGEEKPKALSDRTKLAKLEILNQLKADGVLDDEGWEKAVKDLTHAQTEDEIAAALPPEPPEGFSPVPQEDDGGDEISEQIEPAGKYIAKHRGGPWWEIISVTTGDVIDKVRGQDAAYEKLKELGVS